MWEIGKIDPLLPGAAIAAFSLIAATTDLFLGRIFNAFNLIMLLSGLLYSFTHGGWSALGNALFGVLAGLLLYGWMFALRFMGGGDVKFLMALGAWGGLAYVIEVALLGIFLGGAMAFLILLFKGRVVSFYQRMQHFFLTVFIKELSLEKPKIDQNLTMPYGIPIAVAAVWTIYLHPMKGMLFEFGVRL